MLDFFEQQVILGVFTHRTTYLPTLLDSKRRHLPDVPILVTIADGTIQENMMRLYQAFLKTTYRYWVFLDDDIEFLSPNTVRDAVHDMIDCGWGLCGTYMTYLEDWGRTPDTYVTSQLTRREVTWLPGYFMMADREQIGHIGPNMAMPTGNTGLDTSYCFETRLAGKRIGISRNVVYHKQKYVPHDYAAGQLADAWIRENWGAAYWDVTRYQNNILEVGV